jgi:hypothetical protein
MTAEKAAKLAQAAFDLMAEDPAIWLTHGLPSADKEQRIVGIIGGAILGACLNDQAVQEWQAFVATLVHAHEREEKS